MNKLSRNVTCTLAILCPRWNAKITRELVNSRASCHSSVVCNGQYRKHMMKALSNIGEVSKLYHLFHPILSNVFTLKCVGFFQDAYFSFTLAPVNIITSHFSYNSSEAPKIDARSSKCRHSPNYDLRSSSFMEDRRVRVKCTNRLIR